MPCILTVTPNAAVDITYRVEGFALDRVHRPAETRVAAGGKGINVARVYRRLGGEAVATGFLGGRNGSWISASLDAEGIRNACVPLEGEARLCIAIVDPLTGSQTEVNEAGPYVATAGVDALVSAVDRILAVEPVRTLALCGSLPPGAPDDLYARLIGVARRHGVPAALDASGAALRLGAEARPWLLKPNQYELESLAMGTIDTPAAAVESARSILGGGTEIALVTLGRAGAFCVTEQVTWFAAPPEVDFVSAVGSGDSFLAAFLYSYHTGGAIPDALALAAGAGAANAEVYGSGFIELSRVKELAAQSVPTRY